MPELTETTLVLFKALQSGTLLELLRTGGLPANLNDELRRFLPLLMLSAFSSSSLMAVGMEDEGEIEWDAMDPLRSRLLKIRAGNHFLRFMQLDFTQVEARCQALMTTGTSTDALKSAFAAGSSFAQLGDEEKVLAVCVHLSRRMKNKGEAGSFNGEQNAELSPPPCPSPFDQNQWGEEVLWILCLLSHHFPQSFNPLSYADALLYCTEGGLDLLLGIVLNHPELLEHLLEEVVEAGDSSGGTGATLLGESPRKEAAGVESNAGIQRRREAVLMLLQLLPAARIESFLQESVLPPTASIVDLPNSAFCKLGVDILCSRHISTTSFLTVLINRLAQRADSFSQFLTKQSRNSMRLVCERMSREMHSLLQAQASATNEADGHLAAMHAEKLCVLTALVCSHSFRLSNEDTRLWLHFLISVGRAGGGDVNPMMSALAALLACPTLSPNQPAFRDEAAEKQIITFFQSLRQLIASSSGSVADLSSSSQYYSSLSRMMLLAAIHMTTGKEEELGALLSSTLGFKLSCQLKKIPTLRTLYLRHAMTERDIAEEAVKLEVTRSLNAGSGGGGGGYLPLHCINHLIASRAFAKHQIAIEVWIKAQLLECSTPVHPSMVVLLESYATSCISSVDFPPEHCHNPIDEEFFIGDHENAIFPPMSKLFGDRPSAAAHTHLTRQVLSLFYLCVYSYLREVMPPIRGPLPTYSVLFERRLLTYSHRLWARVPIRYLLLAVDALPSEFGSLRPALLRYIGTSMPHMIPPLQASLRGVEEELASLYAKREGGGFKLWDSSRHQRIRPPLILAEGSKDARKLLPEQLYDTLTNIEHLPIDKQYRYFDLITGAMLKTLEAGTPGPCVEKLVQLWERLEAVVPRCLYEETLRLWLNSPYAAITGTEGNGPAAVSSSGRRPVIAVDEQMIISEIPLMMFRVDERVLQSAPHLRCLMHILQFYLDAAKSANNLRLLKAYAHNPQPARGENEEKAHLLKSMIGAQSLAVVQLLLELCDGDVEKQPGLRAIREVACAQIHQMFIADSLLAKLVHFNGYPIRLIPVMVELVPSAHLLIGNINELLMVDNLERRVFGITLMAHLLRKYRIPAAFAGADLVINLIDTLLAGCAIDSQHIDALHKLVPALRIIIETSPFHSDSIKATLRRVERICASRMALSRSCNAMSGHSSKESQLIRAIDQCLLSHSS